MTKIIQNTILLGGIFLLLFLITELLHRKLKVHAEITRKIVHVTTGIITLLFPFMIGNHWFVLLLCSAFLFILITSLKWNLLPSINGVQRSTVGSILFPITVYFCYLLAEKAGNFTLYFIPILILAISDPLAAFVGKRWPWKKFESFKQTKTISGSLAFLISATIISLVLFNFFFETSIIRGIIPAIIVAFSAAFAEGISHGGYDNISIPGSVVIVLLIFQQFQIL